MIANNYTLLKNKYLAWLNFFQYFPSWKYAFLGAWHFTFDWASVDQLSLNIWLTIQLQKGYNPTCFVMSPGSSSIRLASIILLTIKRVGGHIVPPLAHLRYLWQKLLIERTKIVIVNSSISVAVVLIPFWGPSDIQLNLDGPRLE